MTELSQNINPQHDYSQQWLELDRRSMLKNLPGYDIERLKKLILSETKMIEMGSPLIGEVGLNVRPYNALVRAGIWTVDGAYSMLSVGYWPHGIGPKTAGEILRKIERYRIISP